MPLLLNEPIRDPDNGTAVIFLERVLMNIMRRNFLPCIIILACSLAYAGVDLNPKSAGTTTGRNALGNAFEASFHNPALLGVDRAPTSGLLLFPITDLGVGYYSDKLHVSPFNRYWADNEHEFGELTSRIFARSFNITDNDVADTTGAKVSDKLTRGLKDGFSIYTGARTSLTSIAWKRIAFDITTHADGQVRIPEGPLFLLFSRDQGLLRDNALDFSTFHEEALWATDFTLSLGLPVTIPALHEFFNLKYGAGGVGIKYVMGHSILRAVANKGSLVYNSAPNVLNVDGNLLIQSAGSGMHGNFQFENPFETGLPVSGHGIGVNIGGILYDEHGTMTINVENLGVLFWVHNTKEATYKIKSSDLDLWDIYNGVRQSEKNAGFEIFNRDSGEYLSTASDSLVESSGFVTSLPLRLNFGYAHRWDFSEHVKNQRLRLLSEYGTLAANYEQDLTSGPGESYIPRLSIGSELGTLKGYLPLRMGIVLGGNERVASSLGFGFNFKYFSIQAAYKAIGHLFFVPAHGMELAGGLNINWGMKAVHKEPAPPPRPMHDTTVVRDTVIRKDTVVVHDTTTIHDTINVIRLMPTEKEEKALAKELKGVNFQTASAELTTDSYSHLLTITTFLKQYPYLRYEVQGHTDAVGGDDYNLLLSAARAASVRNFLTGQGIPDSSLIAIGYGKNKPIASNKTAAGRALNRRVQFEVIKNDEDYARLKILEADFRERVRAAQIKGAP
jgi:outer membrane protein OmpA-like peptidoglycan-associated protein